MGGEPCRSSTIFGYEGIRLLVAHVPWSVNVVDFHQYFLLSLRPHIGFSDDWVIGWMGDWMAVSSV